ncbi:MAG: cytosine/uracil/thiamine/allantoin permease [Saprospiraceae bacterium]|jgi:cytosine/uracil/thiamine/allantoin permease
MKNEDIVILEEDLSGSNLYSEDLKPVPPEERTWSMWSLAALWVGMAVCIPTYLLASYMIGSGMTWLESLIIIGIANLIITIPMVLNGHAGVKYGIPFPVLGRSSFGITGIHIPAVVRAIVACGWFGIQTWIGGLAIYAIFNALTGGIAVDGISFGKFVGFGIFWLLNMYFIWKGTESIKFLEQYSAPILILMGLILIGWGASEGGGFKNVLNQSHYLAAPSISVESGQNTVILNLAMDNNGNPKATEYRLFDNGQAAGWLTLDNTAILLNGSTENRKIQVRKNTTSGFIESAEIPLSVQEENTSSTGSKMWSYILWLTIMVGFWATMSLSIADITRYSSTQKEQVLGQFIGLPGTMMLYSFVGIFVSCAAVIIFDDILIGNNAPWDPVTLLAKFQNPVVVIVSQIFMIIATLSTNIAANVIAPANAFSNLNPKKISFKMGGLITGIIGIIICPWYLMDQISNILIFISGLLGPVLGIMLSDYYLLRKMEIPLSELYKEEGQFKYSGGFNISAMIALGLGVFVAIIGYFVPSLDALYKLSWFSGFFVSFFAYYLLMKSKK